VRGFWVLSRLAADDKMERMELATLVRFVVYLVVLLGIGFYFYRKNVSIEDYLLGGRGMGAWVTALSAQASDMSGRLYEIVPGFIGNCMVIFLINMIVKQKDAKILSGYEEVIGIIKKVK